MTPSADKISVLPSRGETLKAWVRALDSIKLMQQAPETTLVSMLGDLARAHGDKLALLGEGEQLGFRQLEARANRVARWAVAEDIAGHTVCLLMPNRPDYVAIWLGLTRAGCVAALLNTNLAGPALMHCIRAAGATHLIVDSALLALLDGGLPAATRIWLHADTDAGEWPQLGSRLGRHDDSPLDNAAWPMPKPSDVALLIYTSGTTGLPKAARVTHGRILEWSLWFAGMMDARPDDRLYDCLPLYHSVGGVVAIGAMLVRGGSVLIAKRFSASRFWDDVVDGECTIVQYIGELCRYLTLSPRHEKERLHQLRLACGNGLQDGVWQNFQDRFAIPRILEFYAATEGNVSLYNCEGKPGAIGRVPPFLSQRFPVALIRCDQTTGQPLRDAAGLCYLCLPDEIGEAIGRLDKDTAAPARQFDGYLDKAASERKILCDVFAVGDRWFRTGDLMRKDAAGFFTFVDRMGDTFRWKGENVSTTEVAAVLRSCPGVIDAVVYGVTVPGYEGRAGMAALTTDQRFDFTVLTRHLATALPAYAQPLFVRLSIALDVTGTFKLTKTRLAEEGYAGISDPVWFNDRVQGAFVACDLAVLRSISDGGGRL